MECIGQRLEERPVAFVLWAFLHIARSTNGIMNFESVSCSVV
jgi:hypothetical protein